MGSSGSGPSVWEDAAVVEATHRHTYERYEILLRVKSDKMLGLSRCV